MTDPQHAPPFVYSPIIERPPLRWPGGAKVAVYIGLNIEQFVPDEPSTSIWPGTAELRPDPLNFGWRDYGARVGIWRTIEALDAHHVRPSVLLNSNVIDAYPQIVAAGLHRNWAWLAHGRTNSKLHTAMSVEDERIELRHITETIAAATRQQPKGWMGPGLTETHHTPELLVELGYRYVLDWTNDDQPYRLTVPGMLSVPYSVELNDLLLFSNGYTGAEFVQIVVDQYEQLRADSTSGGRILALALHPFVIGQPFRHKYFEEVLRYLSAQPDAWLATSDEIAEHFLTQ